MPLEIVPLEARLLPCSTPAGFPSPAADDIEEPIDLGTWLIEQPAASYVMRVDGTSMAGAGINDVLERIVSGAVKNHELDRLLAWNWKACRQQDRLAA